MKSSGQHSVRAGAVGANRGYRVFALVLAAVLSLMLFHGMRLSITLSGKEFFFSAFSPRVQLVCMAGIFVASTIVLYFVFTRLVQHAPQLFDSMERMDARLPAHPALAWSAKSVAAAALIVFVVWSPWLVLQYPTAMNGDTCNQLIQFISPAPTYYTTVGITVPAEFVDHHPVFDTLIFGSFYQLGAALGSPNIGLFAYAALQTVLTAVVLCAAVCYMDRLGLPRCMRLACLVFVALFCVYPQTSMTMTKDSLYCLVFVPYLLLCLELYRTQGSVARRPGFLVTFAVVSVLVVLTKKPGFIIFAIAALVQLIVYRKQLKGFLASVLVVVVCCQVLVPSVVYPAIGGVAPGGRQEVLSPLLQQTVAAVRVCDDIQSEERAALERVIDVEKALKKFNPVLSDGVKNRFRKNVETADILAFVGAWASIGIRHPDVYIGATLGLTERIVFPFVMRDTYYASPRPDEKWIPDFEARQGVELQQSKPASLQGPADAAASAWKAVSQVPVLDFALSRGFFVWATLALAALAIANRRESAVPLAAVFASLLILLLSPTNSMRYVLPFAYALVPLFALWAHSWLLSKANTAS